MSKELEALKRIIDNQRIDVESIERNDKTSYEEDIKIIQQALQRLEAIDNAKPSEALKELFRIDGNITYLLSGDCDINEEVDMNFSSIRDNKSCEIIKQALITKSKKELAFDEFNKYISDLYKHRNDYEKKMLYEFEIDNAVIRASTIEEIYNKFKEVLECQD